MALSCTRTVGLIPLLMLAGPAPAQGPRALDRAEYADRLRAMWLGECIANWTGLRTEGARFEPPFYTDADWGTDPPNGPPIQFVTHLDPWWSDDDTDIEYVYLHLLDQHGGDAANVLTSEQIFDGWIDHIGVAQFIWVSNRRARELMQRGVHPPATGLGVANLHWLMIDAQLTTEFFGALCPGMPEQALALADLPIRTTAGGYAAHASQFFVVLYSLATQADPTLSGRDRVLWLANQARRYVPDGSKAADVADFVLAEFLANPDVDHWELTRDRIYERYQRDAWEYGFIYRNWFESTVNFATALMALLYGEGDFRRTVQIGTLSGWDSDNGTATMGGLIGLLVGEEAIRDAFPGVTLSSRYWISRTRNNLPDHTPADPGAEDAFPLMAERMMPIVERSIVAGGGIVESETGRWLLPPPAVIASGDALGTNPLWQEHLRSANTLVPALGGTVTTAASVTGNPPAGYGVASVAPIANGLETDWSGVEVPESRRVFCSTQGSGSPPGVAQTFTVLYDRPVEVAVVRLVEGEHYDEPVARGGWFTSASVEVRLGAAWSAPPGGATLSEGLNPDVPFQILDWTLAEPVMATGVRVTGPPGGAGAFVTVAELDALSAPMTVTRPSFDLNRDGVIDVEDLYSWFAAPVDLDGDGDADVDDSRYQEAATRWMERQDMLFGRDR